MGIVRQNIQMRLAFPEGDGGEAPGGSRAGDRNACGGVRTRSPAEETAQPAEPPCTDPYARWCDRESLRRPTYVDFREIRAKEAIMAKTAPQQQQATGQRAAIYARVSDKSQDTEDKTSLSEQVGEMEAYCEGKGLTITARYQEVGRGWSKKRPEFQRMLADAKSGRFDTIVCWKSDRLSRACTPQQPLWRWWRRTRFGLRPSWTPST